MKVSLAQKSYNIPKNAGIPLLVFLVFVLAMAAGGRLSFVILTSPAWLMILATPIVTIIADLSLRNLHRANKIGSAFWRNFFREAMFLSIENLSDKNLLYFKLKGNIEGLASVASLLADRFPSFRVRIFKYENGDFELACISDVRVAYELGVRPVSDVLLSHNVVEGIAEHEKKYASKFH